MKNAFKFAVAANIVWGTFHDLGTFVAQLLGLSA